jgi:hypothetical protein
MRKARTELTAEAVMEAIKTGKPTSMTKLAHLLGHKGSVSGSLTKRLRALVPDIDVLLKRAAESARGDAKAPVNPPKAGKAAKGKPDAKAKGKWPHDGRSPFREGSSYDRCVSIMIGHPEGLPRERLVELLAQATGKDLKRASFDVQVVCSARKNDEGLNPFEGPRNRSCKGGFYVERTNGHVKIVFPGTAKEAR